MGYTYCMSDIHSDKESFLKMLEIIDFKEEDKLYILGNVFGYGSDTYGLYEELRYRINIIPLLGDQDIKLHDSIILHKNKPVSPCHLQMAMRDEISWKQIQRVAFFIRRMKKWQVSLKVNGVEYLLAPAQTTIDLDMKDYRFFAYGSYVDSKYHANGVDGYVSVVGHFETNYLRNKMNEEPVTPNTIWLNPKGNVYGIDCGNAMRGRREGNRLGCLRLNDKKCFYV